MIETLNFSSNLQTCDIQNLTIETKVCELIIKNDLSYTNIDSFLGMPDDKLY